MSKTAQPITALFDDLICYYDQYCKHSTTSEFYDFVLNQEESRKQWEESNTECVRLQKEAGVSQNEISRQERKIQEVRRHLESKMEIVNKLELQNERLELRNQSARSLLNSYINDARISTETKERLTNVLAMLESGDSRKHSTFNYSMGVGLDAISEYETTDLSMTQSEDDLDISGVRIRRRKSKRPSMEASIIHPNKKQRKSARLQATETPTRDHVITKTTLCFPKDGYIQAKTSMKISSNAVLSLKSSETKEFITPSAPPLTASESEAEQTEVKVELVKPESPKPPPYELSSITTGILTGTIVESPRFGRTLSSIGTLAMRPHIFCLKTVITNESCGPCGKKITFCKPVLKCRDCNASCHPDCKDKVPLPCVSGTPSKKNQMGTIADYAPNTHPMVPALIQHCVNEVEVRGLETVGLYRVPAAEREVKELKEKFLKGKGVPNLSKYDVYAVCGCLKDFLRSLQEPLIGRWFWRDFALACELSNEEERHKEIDRIVQDLPPPNQDTLAFVLLHLQRVAEATAVKMPIGNLAKVFGPTIVGYSGPDIDAQTMLKETKKQQAVMETLLNMSSEFWTKFVYRQEEQISNTPIVVPVTPSKSKTFQTPMTPKCSSAHSLSRLRSSARKMYFTDDSPKDTPRTRQKRRFFD